MSLPILQRSSQTVSSDTVPSAGAGPGGQSGWRRMLQSVLLLVVGGWVSVSWATSTGGDLQIGKHLSESCAMCHGADGNSSKPAFPSLAGQSKDYLLEQLRSYRDDKRVCYGHPTMNVLARHLTDRQMQALALYYSKQKRKYPHGQAVGSIAGHHLYHFGRARDQVGACEYCHGIHGSGHYVGHNEGFPTLRGLSQAYVRKTLHEFRKGYRTGGHTHIMRHITGKLSDADIDELAKYVAILH